MVSFRKIIPTLVALILLFFLSIILFVLFILNLDDNLFTYIMISIVSLSIILETLLISYYCYVLYILSKKDIEKKELSIRSLSSSSRDVNSIMEEEDMKEVVEDSSKDSYVQNVENVHENIQVVQVV